MTEEKANGRLLVLATAAERTLADLVAARVTLFDEVLGSDGVQNLKGSAKLEGLTNRFGTEFDYVGDSSADLPLWRACRMAIVVNATPSVLQAAKAQSRIARIFARPKVDRWKLIAKQLRLRQWIKNGLIFVPLATSHQLGNPAMLRNAIICFFSFSLCASCVYVINDFADLDSDRQHARKRFRPFASGQLSLAYAFVLAPLLIIAAFTLTLLLPIGSTIVLSAYFATTLAYSFQVKRQLLLDVFVLAGLYTIRIVAGQEAYRVEISSWLLAFSVFLFLSLGFCKRSSELINVQRQGGVENVRRGYRLSDLPMVNTFGVAAGYLASLVLALYMNSDNIRILYRHPDLLWLLFPLILFWISRIWIITARGAMSEDPIEFAVKDRVTWVVAGLFILLMFIATRQWKTI